MANYYGTPTILTDGLIFAVDAGNGQSYVSGSATCVDMISNLDGTLVNSAEYEGINQGTWAFDGVNDYIRIGDLSTALIPGSAFSIEGWFMSDSFAAGNPETIAACSQGDSGGYHWKFLINDSSQLSYTIRTTQFGPPFYETITGGTTLVIDTWYHGCTTWDGSNLYLYLNGISDATPVACSSFYHDTEPGPYNLIGARVQSNFAAPIDDFFGNIASVKVYNKALTAAEALQNYNATKNRFI
tara:strand:- start:25435 stop:26160 length:726 start_codon:yes stop_codon:yes gene_type:complete